MTDKSVKMRKGFIIDMDDLEVYPVSVRVAGMDAGLLYFERIDGQSGVIEPREVFSNIKDAMKVCRSYCLDMATYYKGKAGVMGDRIKGLGE